MLRVLAAAVFVSAFAFAQAEKPPLKFDVCDIQVSKIEDPRQMSANFLPGGRVDVRGMPMKTILAAINKVPENMIDGPGWMASERYDVICKANPKSTDDELFEMARNMMVERFKLVSHTEKRPMPAYALTAGKSVKLTPTTDATNVGCPAVPADPAAKDPPGVVHRVCHAISMDDLAHLLPSIAPAYFEGLPVVNMTDLKGAFDFHVDWMGRGAYNAAMLSATSETPADERAISIFDAMQKLGLKLENKKLPVDVIVIDSVLKAPISDD